MYNILIVDDDEAVRNTLKQTLSKYGYVPYEASCEAETIRAVKNLHLDLILLDLVMPGPDGMETLLELKKLDPDMPVIMMTGQGDIPTAVEAIKVGAYDFIAKPLQTNRLIQAIQGGLERLELRRSARQLQTSLEWIFGKSLTMQGVIQKIRQAAWGKGAIVLHGEAGAGKSVTAHVIHNLSKRAHLPFQSVRMDAISGSLVETKLFGLKKGASGNPEGARKGVIESAKNGTVFIDGLNLIPLAAQDKLFKVMEERQIYPVDASTPVEIDVRIIMGTDTDPKTLMRNKQLTEGLYRLLNGCVITLPPLRERLEDVRLLASKFLWKASIEMNRQSHELDDETIEMLTRHSWPGNVGELENTVRRAVLSSEDGVIKPEQVKSIIDHVSKNRAPLPLLPHKATVSGGPWVKEGGEAISGELPRSEEHYRGIIGLSPCGIFICAGERIEFANPALAHIIGTRSPEELCGSVALDFFSHEYRDLMKDAIQKVTTDREKTPPLEQKVVRLNGSFIDVEVTAFPFTWDGLDAVMVAVEDVAQRKQTEEALRTRERELREKTKGLEDANTALKVLVAHKDQDKEVFQNAILNNVKQLVFPYLEKVRGGRLTESQAAYMDMIESSLNHIVSPFLQKLAGAYSRFTPTEIQVADMIRNSKTTKEIAEMLNVCAGTIEGHRNSIRKKLGLSNKKTNLQSYLSSM